MLFLDKYNIHKVLLINPNFPTKKHSSSTYNVLPIGLLKIGSYLKHNNVEVSLVNLCIESDIPSNFFPDLIMITSLFSWYGLPVKQAVEEARKLYPNTPIIVGGIWASMEPDVCQKYTQCDEIYQGVMFEAESIPLDYTLLNYHVDFQILHTSRGCTKKCSYCNIPKTEPQLHFKNTIKNEIMRRNIILYDNNFLSNPNVNNILDEFIDLKKRKMITSIHCLSGFDKYYLTRQPELAQKIKQAGFSKIHIAWDEGFNKASVVKKAVELFVQAGYSRRNISVFLLYNYNIDFDESEKKRIFLFKLGVRPFSTRFRPSSQHHDNFNPNINQTNQDYYISPLWTDELVKQFRRNCKNHIFCILHGLKFYSPSLYKNKVKMQEYRHLGITEVNNIVKDCWNPLLYNGGLL